jgi:hypothetical protein
MTYVARKRGKTICSESCEVICYLKASPMPPASQAVQPGKSAQEASKRQFWNSFGSSPEDRPRRPPENHFGAFSAPARKIGSGGFQKDILEHFRLQPGKSAQDASRR